jgi:hypothetical protein
LSNAMKFLVADTNPFNSFCDLSLSEKFLRY